MKRKSLVPMFTLGSMFAALGLAIFFRIKAEPVVVSAETLSWLDWFGTIFMNGLLMSAIPLATSNIILGFAQISAQKKMVRVSMRALGLYFITTLIATTLGVGMFYLVYHLLDLLKSKGFIENGRAILSILGEQTTNTLPENDAMLAGVKLPELPKNIGALLSQNDHLLYAVILAGMIGLNLNYLTKKTSQSIIHFAETISSLFGQLIQVWMYLSPLGVASLMFRQVYVYLGEQQLDVFDLLLMLGLYVFVIMLGLFIMLFIVYPCMIYLFSNQKPTTFLRTMRPAQWVAFSTSSSNAALPVNIRQAEKMGVSPQISRLILPLGANMNMDGTVIYQAVAILFIAHGYSLEPISWLVLTKIIFSIALFSLGLSGAPGASIGTTTSICTLYNLHPHPANALGLLMGLDRLLDMSRTMCNITGDAAVSVIINTHLPVEETAPPVKKKVTRKSPSKAKA